MPKDLKSKVANLLDDISRLNKHEAIRRVESFVNEELNFLTNEHYLDISDLLQIKCSANNNWQESSLVDTIEGRKLRDSHDLRTTMSWVSAVSTFLVGQGLLASHIKFKK